MTLKICDCSASCRVGIADVYPVCGNLVTGT